MNYSFTLNFEKLINELEIKKYNFVDQKFQSVIKNIIKNIFQVLNSKDINYLFLLTRDLIEIDLIEACRNTSHAKTLTISKKKKIS